MKTKTFKKLYHVGLLENRANRRSDSQEGHCLSVSECPEAWKQIAKLGGYPTWELVKPKNAFLHAHKLTKTERKRIEQWGLEHGLVTQGIVFKTWSTDEDGESQYALFASREEAESELPFTECDETKELQGVEEVPQCIATEALNAYAEQRVDFLFVSDMLQLCYADRVLGLDGVFWDDVLDPYGYSAPRAGILPQRLAEWTVCKVND